MVSDMRANDGAYKLHYTIASMLSIGCTRMLHPNKFTLLYDSFHYTILQEIDERTFCGEHPRVPEDWLAVGPARGASRKDPRMKLPTTLALGILMAPTSPIRTLPPNNLTILATQRE